MIYCQTVYEERIAVHPMNDVNNTQVVELVKYGDEPIMLVTLYDGKENWMWEFDITNPSHYERIKLTIFDMIHECDTMKELALMLDSIFIDGFSPILIGEDPCEDCEGCEFCDVCNE